jgi:hypothetical protein
VALFTIPVKVSFADYGRKMLGVQQLVRQPVGDTTRQKEEFHVLAWSARRRIVDQIVLE